MNAAETGRLVARLTAEYDQSGETAENCSARANIAATCASNPHALAGLLIAACDGAEASGRERTARAILSAVRHLIRREWDPKEGIRECPRTD